MSLSPPLLCWVFWSSLVPEALEIPMAITRPSQALCLKGCRARSCLGLGWPGNTTCFSCSLKALFPTGGPIRGCMKGLKALGKYVDLKRMSTVGVSYGCTSDLLVSTSPGSLASMVGKGSVREREHRTCRTGSISPCSHRNKHKTPRSSVQGGCGKVLHAAGRSAGQTQRGPEHLSYPPSTPAGARAGLSPHLRGVPRRWLAQSASTATAT